MTKLKTRDMVIVDFPSQVPQGHEQEGRRPALIIGIPKNPRFGAVVIVPLTRDTGQTWATKNPNLYPKLPTGTSGLPQASIVMLDQIRCLDLKRVGRQVGQLTPEEYAPILEGLQSMLEVV